MSGVAKNQANVLHSNVNKGTGFILCFDLISYSQNIQGELKMSSSTLVPPPFLFSIEHLIQTQLWATVEATVTLQKETPKTNSICCQSFSGSCPIYLKLSVYLPIISNTYYFGTISLVDLVETPKAHLCHMKILTCPSVCMSTRMACQFHFLTSSYIA